jgi:hypothetical protein
VTIVQKPKATAYLYAGVHETNSNQHSVCVNKWKNVSVRWKEEELHPVPDNFMVLPEDLFTHLGDFESACSIAYESAINNPDQDDEQGGDAAYWRHQLNTIAKIKKQIETHYGKPELPKK